MRPVVTVLQLDTDFPRVPGDVGCPETYIDSVEILRIPQATVGQIVSATPAAIPIEPFEEALGQATGEIIVTSCGFLSYWQDHLAAQTDKLFVSSALTALPDLCARYAPKDILTLTFDANSLNAEHYRSHQTDVIGLATDMHLRCVISQNRNTLDVDLARHEVVGHLTTHCKPHHKHILLECTNLPPYKAAIIAATGLPVTDILTCIEAIRPQTINPAFLYAQETHK